MIVIEDSIWLCPDCMIAEVNGDYSGLDYYYSGKEAESRKRAITEGLSKLTQGLYYLAMNFDTETGEGYLEFSSHHSCDSCGSGLAGSFYRFSLLGSEQQAAERQAAEQPAGKI